MKKTLLLIGLFLSISLIWGQIFTTDFGTEENWDNPGGSWTAYNEKTYSEGGWFFHSTSSVRGGESESFSGSQYSFRDRDVFSLKNTAEVNGMSGFSFQLRDWMLGDGEQRDVNVSLNGGQDWETVFTINKDWFDEYQVYQPFVHFFDVQHDFAAEEFQLEIINGGNTNNGRINIGQFEALGEAEPSLIVISPNGGEEWEQGSTQFILWSSVLFDGNVNISLEMIDGREREILAEDIENTGEWEWTIPETQPIDDWYVIIVEGVNPGDPWDQSDGPFSIIEPIVAPELSIYEIQYTEEPADGTYPSLYEGEWVQTQGVITAIFGNGFYMQDGVGAWNGINVYPSTEGIQVGDEIVIRGTITEYYGKTEIIDYEIYANNGQMPLPEPVSITTGELASEEMYESVLVQVHEVTVTDPDLGYGEWQIDDFIDSSGPCIVDDLGDYTYTPVQDDFIYSITGICDYNYGAYKLEPRNDDDFNFGGLVVEPMTLEFFTIEDCVDGLEFTIHNGSSETVTIIDMDTDGNFDTSGWWNIQDFNLTLPYEMEADELLTFNVIVGLPVTKEIVTDFLQIETSAGDFEITLYFETDLVSSTEPEQEIPSAAMRATNYPNPFNPQTTIQYYLPEDSHTMLTVYNAKGQIVTELVNGIQNVGHHHVNWDGKDSKQQTVSNGIYFYRLESGNKTLTQKMILLK